MLRIAPGDTPATHPNTTRITLITLQESHCIFFLCWSSKSRQRLRTPPPMVENHRNCKKQKDDWQARSNPEPQAVDTLALPNMLGGQKANKSWPFSSAGCYFWSSTGRTRCLLQTLDTIASRRFITLLFAHLCWIPADVGRRQARRKPIHSPAPAAFLRQRHRNSNTHSILSIST